MKRNLSYQRVSLNISIEITKKGVKNNIPRDIITSLHFNR